MEPEGSLPRLQVPATCPYPKLDQSCPFPPPPSHFLEIHLIIILPSTPGSSKLYLSLRFPYQNPERTSPLFVLHVPQWTSHSTQFDPIITASTISQRIVGNWQLAYPLHVGSSSIELSCLWVTCNVRHGAKRRVTDDRIYRALWRQQSHSWRSTDTMEWWIQILLPSRTNRFNYRNLRYSERLHDLGKIACY